MKYFLISLLLFLLTLSLNAQDIIKGGNELLKKIDSFPEEYVNKKIVITDIWASYKASKVLKSDYYRIYLSMNSDDFFLLGSDDSGINSVITKKLAKKVINESLIDTENKKYLSNVYGKIKKDVYWFASYTLIIDKVEIKSWDGTVTITFE